MSLEQYKDNQFTKERDNVEKYLLRMIQRFFDTQNVYTQNSIEAIIVESIARYKQDIYHEKGEFLYSFNGKTGNVLLTIQDLNGEESFEKQNAFNKDFGSIKDTICEGNDLRLSDNRTPLYHEHDSLDINNLQETIDNIYSKIDTHVHENKDVLKKIKYTGKEKQIDLIILERLQEGMKNYYENLLYYQREVKAIKDAGLENINSYINVSENKLEYAKEITKNITDWTSDFKKYTDNNTELFSKKYKSLFTEYLTKDKSDSFKKNFNNIYHLIKDGTIQIPKNTFSLSPVLHSIENIIDEDDRDTVENIYNNGIKIGNDDWVWNEEENYFIYNHNEESTYPMLLTSKKFTKYIHLVNLSSEDSDDDIISVVIAYDKDTNKNLSLLISNGGVISTGATGATATVVLNYNNNYTIGGDLIIGNKSIGPAQPWSSTTEGVTVLVKLENNNVKIWINYNTPNEWEIENTDDGKLDVNPDTQPDFDFNLTNFTELNDFVNKEVHYGYGCFSQNKSVYTNIFFGGTSITPIDYKHTNILEKNILEINTSVTEKLTDKQIKAFLKYDVNGETVTTQLPFLYKTKDGNIAVIQLRQEDGKYFVETNMINIIPLEITKNNFYNDTTVIGPGNKKISYDDIKFENKYFSHLCFVDSDDKTNFIKSKITSGDYIIHGMNVNLNPDDPDTFTFINELTNQPLTYFNWDKNQPQYITKIEDCIKINKNNKWEVIRVYDEYLPLLEYEIKCFSDYFQNARIYYQIFGTEEAI